MSFGNFLGDPTLIPQLNPSYDDILLNSSNPLKNWKKIYCRKLGVGQITFLLNNYAYNPSASTYRNGVNPINNFLPGNSSIQLFYTHNLSSNVESSDATFHLIGDTTATGIVSPNVIFEFCRINNKVFLNWDNMVITNNSGAQLGATVDYIYIAPIVVNNIFLPAVTPITGGMNWGAWGGMWENQTVNAGPSIISTQLGSPGGFSFYMTFCFSICGTQAGTPPVYKMNLPFTNGTADAIVTGTNILDNTAIILMAGSASWASTSFRNAFPSI